MSKKCIYSFKYSTWSAGEKYRVWREKQCWREELPDLLHEFQNLFKGYKTSMVSRLCWLSYQQDNQQQPSNVLEYRVLQLDPSVRLRTLLAWIIFSQAAEPYFGAAALEFCDHSEGSCSRGVGAPVCIVGVLSTFQEILVSMVVWLLIQDPCTIHHYAGAQFPKPEGLIN